MKLVWLKSRTFGVSRDARLFGLSLARHLRDCETNFSNKIMIKNFYDFGIIIRKFKSLNDMIALNSKDFELVVIAILK